MSRIFTASDKEVQGIGVGVGGRKEERIRKGVFYMKKASSFVISLIAAVLISGCAAENSEAQTVNEDTTTTVTTTAATTKSATATSAVSTTVPAVTTEVTTTKVETTTKAPIKPDVDITSTKKVDIVVNNEDGVVSLNVEPLSESPEFIYGTSIASATAALNYYGFGCAKSELLKYMPIVKSADENGLWEDPNDYFLGDPEGNEMGYCSSSVLKDTITSYWEANNITDYEVIDLSGTGLTELYSEIDAGNPVIIWVEIAMHSFNGTQELPLKNGNTFIYCPLSQCMVLVGYKNGNKVIVSDPAKIIAEYDTYMESDALGSYEMMGEQALVIHKK